MRAVLFRIDPKTFTVELNKFTIAPSTILTDVVPQAQNMVFRSERPEVDVTDRSMIDLELNMS